MFKAKLPFFNLPFIFVLFLSFKPCIARTVENKVCGSTTCGSINISHPFRLKSQPRECGDNRFELECDATNRTRFGKYHINAISYENSTFRVVDASLDEDNCSIPLGRFHLDLFCGKPYVYIDYTFAYIHTFPEYSNMNVLNCTTAIRSSIYVDASRCSSDSPASFFYFLDAKTRPSDFNESCVVVSRIRINVQNITGLSTLMIYEKILTGIELSWGPGYYFSCRDQQLSFSQIMAKVRDALVDYVNSFVYFIIHRPLITAFNGFPAETNRTYIMCIAITGGVLLLRALPGIFCLIAIVIYKWRRRHLSDDDRIEEFLRSQNNLMPIRYSYGEIKRMTRDFKDKLGEGGYGSVFKGKLRSGHFVAVKLLGQSKTNGQDFISEVATIGRIHHVHVAKLVGFCVEQSKQALVYDFMSNGSLDKIIFAKEDKNTLSWQKVFDIALGVARGIEYLHQGCDMQILHFDIKPHNILLDENYIPKVSDFGLAKLYSIDDSIVSLTAARGTIGYIAPELVYKNIGGISYKADVYSFGMLLMEMVGKRKNMNAFDEHKSQRYFPSWIYSQLQQEKDFELGEAVTDEEKIIARKMIITAFWCIQVKPNDRPSMSKALEMLESEVGLIEMPPKPFQLPFEVEIEKDDGDESSTYKPTTSLLSTFSTNESSFYV